MKNNQHIVDPFVTSVQHRLNRHRLWNAVLWSAACGAAAMVVVGLFYVLRGQAVVLSWYAVAGGASLLLANGVWVARRADAERAARFADQFFALEDSVVSYRHFSKSGKRGGFYELQARATDRRVAALHPADIKYRLPRRPVVGMVVLGALAAVLAAQDPSEAVQREIALQQQTLEETRQLNKELEDLVNDLAEEAKGTDEEELLAPEKLRQWVEELQATTDRKEALRQYAVLEQRLSQASARLQQKRDEQLLRRAADELEKDRETRGLAKTLEQKKYEEAVEQLMELKPDAKKEGLSEQRQELARLKAAAQRMSSAVQSLRRNKPNENERQLQRLTRNKDSQELTSADDSSDDLQESELEDLIEELEDAVERWDDALEDAELEESQLGELKEVTLDECKLCQGQVDDKLDELGEKLYRLALKRNAQQKLAMLRRACSLSQSALAQLEGPGAGGKKAGWGTDEEKREERDELIDNQQYTRLEGIQGKGPSTSTVEAAESGSAVSARQHVDRDRTFQRQVESFVQREDVPENVKAGVKEYFENIHQVE